MAGRYKLLFPLDIPRSDKGKKGKKQPEELKPQQENVSAVTEDIGERIVLVPLKDKEVMQSIGLVRQYLRDTGLTANMTKFTSELLKGKMLPYNPYPAYVFWARQLAEKFHVKRESLQVVQRRMAQCQTFNINTGLFAGVKLPDINIWGLEHILLTINPVSVEKYRYAVESSSATKQKISEKCGRDVSTMTTLQGPCMFTGTLADECFELGVHVTVLVKSDDVSRASVSFGKAVLCDLRHINDHADHFFLSLNVPVHKKGIWKIRKWYAEEITPLISSEEPSQAESDLVQAIGSAAVNKQSILLDYLAFFDPEKILQSQQKSLPAVKSYSLMILNSQILANGRHSEPSLLLATESFQEIHEGLFFSQDEAELYTTTFKQYSKFAKTPLAKQVTDVVQKSWQLSIGGKQLESDSIDILHRLFLLERIQSQMKPATTKTEDSLAIQITRLMQGRGIKLERLRPINKVLCTLATMKSHEQSNQVFNEMFYIYSKRLYDFFDENSHELSSTLLAAKYRVINCLEEIQRLAAEDKVNNALPSLRFLSGYLKSLSIALIEDALEFFPMIKRLKIQIDQGINKEFGLDLNVDTRMDMYKHRVDSTHYVDVDKKFLDVSQCALNSRAPQNISTRVSLLQYSVDTRIDQVWKEFLDDILLVRKNLPPNPYPSLVTKLRQSSLKVQLFRETNSVLFGHLSSHKPKLYDNHYQLYTIQGLSAFGSLVALLNLNSAGFRLTQTIASSVAISPTLPGSGTQAIAINSFELRCYIALTKEILLYGSIVPHLTTVSLEEYCFVKGAKGQEHDGIQSLAKIILINIGNMETQGILALEARFSDTSVKLHDNSNSSTRFQNEFASSINAGQAVVLHFLVPIDWRYVHVIKTIHFYYVDQRNDQVNLLTPHNILAPYRQVFFSSNDAGEYSKGISAVANPETTLTETIQAKIQNEMTDAWENKEWSHLATLLLLDSTVGQKEFRLDDERCQATISFCWRLFHSAYGELQCIVSIGKSIIEALKSSTDSTRNVSSITDMLRSSILGFRSKVHLALSRPSTLAVLSIDSYCQNLMQNVAPCNLSTGSVNITNPSTLENALTHVCAVLQAIADAAAMDLLNVSPTVKSDLQTILDKKSNV